MTLNCVGLTHSIVIQIIHCNVGLKRFFHLPNFLLLLLVSACIYISQGSVETGYIILPLLQNVCRVCQCKNFENWSIIGKDMDKSKVARFLWSTMY